MYIMLCSDTVPLQIFLPSPIDPIYAEKLVFEGIGVDLHNGTGEQGNMDSTMAFKTAARNCIAFLGKLGYTKEEAILLLSAAPVDAHVAAVVDSPNACVTMALPVAIFERDIRPHVSDICCPSTWSSLTLPTLLQPDGYEKRDYKQCAIRSDGVI
jgi:formamidase